MKVSRVVAYPENCTGCLICQLRCSFEYTNCFNPSGARLLIERPLDGGHKTSFTDECNNCGLCARFCPYDALRLVKDD